MSPRRPSSATGEAALARWASLVALVEAACEHPTRSTERLDMACERATRAVLPAGECVRENPFIHLLDTAKAFARAPETARIGMVGDLLAAVDAAQALRDLHSDRARDHAEASPPSLPFRRDIDG